MLSGSERELRATPDEILREEFLVPLKLTPYAAALHVPRTRIERIAREDCCRCKQKDHAVLADKKTAGSR